MLERLFDLRGHRTDVRTEVLAGLTTFMTMAYIVVVNVRILEPAFVSEGMSPEEVERIRLSLGTATCVAAALATLLMGVWANYPVGLAPGMGANAYFVIVVTLMGVAWQTALGAVFWAGAIFLSLSLFRLRERIVNAIPMTLKAGIAAGIGLLLASIGLRFSGVIVAAPPDAGIHTVLGDLTSRQVIVAAVVLVVTGALMARKVPGAILWGILVGTALHHAVTRGVDLEGMRVVARPEFGLFAHVDLWAVFRPETIMLLLIFLYMDMFDTVGTLVAVAKEGDLLDERGHLPRGARAFSSDAVGSMAGALLGTSTVTSYIESGSGIAVGGRTGLTAVVVAALFALATLFGPLAGLVPLEATGPALIIVGIMMMGQIREMNWKDWAELLPGFTVILLIPFTNAIHTGIALGFIIYPVVMVLAGRRREVTVAVWILAGVLLGLQVWMHSSGIG